ncbi:hypothetical protein BGX23_002051 [Mortierella sp. AD031]|nr:hypothetical protein BGX23_002051 [Mortierella sp. AD031]
MIVLAYLISYQLGNALWRLWSVVKARKSAKNTKKDLLKDEEVFAVSVKDKKGKYNDGDGNGNGLDCPGRRVNEFSRSGDQSMKSVVGMMGIGSNPTIQCTPASDDEDNGDDEHIDRLSVDRTLFRTIEMKRRNRSSNREATSQVPRSNESDNSERGLGSISEDDGQEFTVDRLGLFVPDADPDSPWVQSAYMTRRCSESTVRKGHVYNRMTPEDRVRTLDTSLPSSSFSQKHRRRPASVGAVRQVIDSMTISYSGQRTAFSYGSRSLRETTRRESLPVFRSTFIPESLLAGPPPPSTIPRRASVSSAMLATPPSLSPILGFACNQESPFLVSPLPQEGSDDTIVESVSAPESATVVPASVAASGSTSTMTSGILNFLEYRFPDERQPLSFEGPSRNVAAHPNDLYSAHMPSPNEFGPAHVTWAPFQRRNSLPTDGSAVDRTSTTHANVPNTPQYGTNSRRETRAVAVFESANASSSSAVVAPLSGRSIKSSSQTAHTRRGVAPGLKIITALNTFTPAPQMPLPTLPPTPFTSTIPDDIMEAISFSSSPALRKGFNTDININAATSNSATPALKRALSTTKLEQQTPTSINWNDGSHDSMLHILTQQESNTVAAAG